MDQYSNTILEIPSFEVMKQASRHSVGNGKKLRIVETIHGRVTTPLPEACPTCGKRLLFNQYLQVKLKHLAIHHCLIRLCVTYEQWVCNHCHHTVTQEIPFKEPGHLITTAFLSMAIGLLSRGGLTIADVADIMHTNRKLVKDLDKTRLKGIYGDMKPTHPSKYLCVDEFLLHKGHRYATVVLDWQTGEILFLEQGNSERQLLHFFQKAGYGWMKHVKAIAMDMNAQYAKAVNTRYPHITVVYDGFHIIKNFNERIITELRRQEQRELQTKISRDSNELYGLNRDLRGASPEQKEEILDQIEEKKRDLKETRQAYSTLKGSRFLLLSSREALMRKDVLSRRHNKELFDRYDYHGLPVPAGERKWSTRNVDRLDAILRGNDALNVAFFLSDQLKAGLDCTNQEEMEDGLRQWLALADLYTDAIPMLKSFNKMIRTRFDGIVSRVKYPISNGPLEGINNMIKTCRRQAYGYRDQEYFFLKIWERSRKYIKCRTLSSSMDKKLVVQSLWIQSHSFFP